MAFFNPMDSEVGTVTASTIGNMVRKGGRREQLQRRGGKAPKPKVDPEAKEKTVKLSDYADKVMQTYQNVSVYLSQTRRQNTGIAKVGTASVSNEERRSWVDTEMCGLLEVANIGKAGDVPIVQLRLVAVDELGCRRGILMEYELHINFIFCPEQTTTFSSLQMVRGEQLGFLFTNSIARMGFDLLMKECQDGLTQSVEQIEAHEKRGQNATSAELARQLGDAVNYQNLFQAADEDKRSKEMMKLLVAAGLDLTEDLGNAELMETIQNVIVNFDPDKPATQEDKAFTAKMAKYQYQSDSSHRERRKAQETDNSVKSKNTGAIMKLNMKEKMHRFVLRKAGEMDEKVEQQRANTEFLHQYWEKIKQWNNVERKQNRLPQIPVNEEVLSRVQTVKQVAPIVRQATITESPAMMGGPPKSTAPIGRAPPMPPAGRGIPAPPSGRGRGGAPRGGVRPTAPKKEKNIMQLREDSTVKDRLSKKIDSTPKQIQLSMADQLKAAGLVLKKAKIREPILASVKEEEEDLKSTGNQTLAILAAQIAAARNEYHGAKKKEGDSSSEEEPSSESSNWSDSD